ncbi:unnamed protein product [Symbiodinium natans]|uniref:Uncharacterized protein n=1 Tax=Symbiodinium natans TaxID=878477 RepID=A0A812U6L4_9DINO|nr:unnamed protein product [Symbiodinium natans]
MPDEAETGGMQLEEAERGPLPDANLKFGRGFLELIAKRWAPHSHLITHSDAVSGPCIGPDAAALTQGGLPDLLTGRRSQGKEEKNKEACGNESEGSEPQPASDQEMKKDDLFKKATAAEEREAFLHALMQDRAEADRLEIEARKEAKRAETMRRLEATNRAVRAQFELLVSAADFQEARVQFVANVEEIPMEGPLAPSAPASSASSMIGAIAKPILKGAGDRKHAAACRGQACGDETPNSDSSDDSAHISAEQSRERGRECAAERQRT